MYFNTLFTTAMAKIFSLQAFYTFFLAARILYYCTILSNYSTDAAHSTLSTDHCRNRVMFTNTLDKIKWYLGVIGTATAAA